jgi:hypothetical protein
MGIEKLAQEAFTLTRSNKKANLTLQFEALPRITTRTTKDLIVQFECDLLSSNFVILIGSNHFDLKALVRYKLRVAES